MTEKRPIAYPWPSALYALLLIAFLYFLVRPEHAQALQIPVAYFDHRYTLPGVAGLLVLMVIDFIRFKSSQVRYRSLLAKHRKQMDEILAAKQALQNRVHTYAGRTDKLKLLVSERLLEYIEYDEKFLHFKNIAAEVRHNGVISYDRVLTALEAEFKKNGKTVHHEAIDSMHYLWDLLDLSTTDNIAVHIANQLYRAEENYFHAQLSETDESAEYSLSTFDARAAMADKLMQLLDMETAAPETRTKLLAGEIVGDTQFRIYLGKTDALLGNKNHLVLILENLISNAQFHAGKARYKNSHARVAVGLQQKKGKAMLSVYNHGPHIDEQNREKLFQLGFSTRQVRDNHGKGLGLHFVSQIVQGYEGELRYENISGRETLVTLRATLSGGAVETRTASLVLSAGQLLCCAENSNDNPGKYLDWTFSNTVRSVEVNTESDTEMARFECAKDTENVSFLDNEHWEKSRWQIDVHNRKRSATLRFRVLDVTGVRFVAELPTAHSRLDYEDTFFEQDDEN